MWYMYMVKCQDDSFYVGMTENIKERIARHNHGKGSAYTRLRRPVRLVYFEQYQNKTEVVQREREVKKFSKVNKEQLIKYGLGQRFPPPQKEMHCGSGLAL